MRRSSCCFRVVAARFFLFRQGAAQDPVVFVDSDDDEGRGTHHDARPHATLKPYDYDDDEEFC